MAKKSAPATTLVTFLLDRTGSMECIKTATIESFNAYLDTLQSEDKGNILFSLVQFDSQSLDKICVREPVKSAPKLSTTNYVPRAATPLVDASYKTIKAVEASLNGDTKTKVVICIQTDGHENASTEHTFAELTALIKEKTALGWQFNFMGASIDAYDQAAKMGLGYAQTMSYASHDPQATRASFVASAANTANFAAGASANTQYSNMQRSASGDAHMHKHDPALNLTTSQEPPKAKAQATSAPPATPKVPPVKPVAVDNFTL